jgi:RND family efflux transporter MFP subunit
MQLLQWGGLWLETLINQQSDARREIGSFTLALMSAILGFKATRTAAMEVVNRLAERIGCERVSIGFRQGLPIRLKALSHVATFDTHTQLVRSIEAAMEEALDQAAVVIHPLTPSVESVVGRAHAELAQQHGHGAICTFPLPGRAATIGAITLERSANQPFDEETVAWVESLTRLIGPALDMKQREERSIWAKGIEAMGDGLRGLLGPSWLKLKLTLLFTLVTLLSLALIDSDYRVTAPASIEGEVRQLLVAPQAGYVREAEVRAGDLVKQGQLIATLDDRKLKLEHRKWQSERNKLEKEYQDALAKRDRTQLSILRAQLDQVDAELHLVEEKIAHTQIRAPFDGVVLSGDLSQSLGSPVETGQVLFEVAPLDSYRVILEVDEHDVAGLDETRSGQLIVAALPQSTFALSLNQVIPIAVAEEGRNYFRVEAKLDQPSRLLRPGMHGIAKVEMGQRKLLWIWTHAVIDRLRLWFWSLGW